MLGRFVRGVVVAATAGIGASLLAPVAASANVACGQTVNVSFTLTHDLVCPGTALFVAGSNITIDLGGHTITGPAPVDGGGTRGVTITPGRTGVTLRNGTIRRFDVGVNVNQGANGATVTGLTLDANGLGIATQTGSSGARLAGNAIVNTARFSAVQLGGDGHRVEGNQMSNGANAGVLVSGHDNAISGNAIADMGAAGVALTTFPGLSGPFRNNQVTGNSISGSSRVFSSASISVQNGSGTIVHGNSVTGRRTGPGVFVNDSAATSVAGNGLSNHNEGVLVRGSSSQTVVAGNVATGNNVGIRVESAPTGNDVTGNVASNNTSDGIRIQSPSTRVASNTANSNGNWGIFAVAGVVDGGGNKAAGNGQPAQCTPNIVCT